MFMRNVCMALCAVTMTLTLWGCTGTNGNAPPFRDGEHPANWLTAHGPSVIQNGVLTCAACHGDDLSGGISKVACADCHGDSLKFGVNSISHVDNWSSLELVTSGAVQNQDDIRVIPFYNFSAVLHGFVAKGASATDPYGYNYCVNCHKGFASAVLPNPPFTSVQNFSSCVGCHGGAPHSLNPNWASFHHITTDPANASFCAPCHTNHANLSATFVTEFTALNAFDPTVSPNDNSCFNGTLCHNANIVQDPIVPHATDGFGLDIDTHIKHSSYFVDSQTFQLLTDKAQLVKNSQACRICHGENLQGRGAATSCLDCHGVNILNSPAYQATTCIGCHNVAAPAPPAPVNPPKLPNPLPFS